jgi:hypothetical protein
MVYARVDPLTLAAEVGLRQAMAPRFSREVFLSILGFRGPPLQRMKVGAFVSLDFTLRPA